MNSAVLIAPIFLLSGRTDCYRCSKSTRVFGVAATAVRDDGDPMLGGEEGDSLNRISEVENLDARIVDRLAERAPLYRLDYSMTQRARVWMNHCEHCGAKQGDHYLHSEPDGPFFAYDSQSDSVSSDQIASWRF